MRGKDGFLATVYASVYASVWCHDILVTAPEMQEEKGFSGDISWVNSEMCQSLVPRDNGHGTRNARGVPLQVYASVWCHNILVMAPEMQEEMMGF